MPLQAIPSLAGLLALAPLQASAVRTALAGTSSWLDCLVLCPGLHQQHKAVSLSGGEFPACAAMTTGYVFRVENPATVLYLQRISRTGKLTTLSVLREQQATSTYPPGGFGVDPSHLAAALVILAMAFVAQRRDWPAVAYLLTLILVRLANTFVIRRQARICWHGQSEPEAQGDLFILLSYDRWVRIRGAVDDLKAVASGRWLREASLVEQGIAGAATCLSYLSPCLAARAGVQGQIVIVAVLLVNAVLVGYEAYSTDVLCMKGRVLRLAGERKAYERRSVLAGELIKESGRVDWALAMGLVPASSVGSVVEQQRGPVIM
ncbi:hypothetical protein Q7P37_000088 [Cladosporium fusiforme]